MERRREGRVAGAVLAAHLEADGTRLGAVVRRPLRRVAALLRALPAGVGAVPVRSAL